MDKRGIFEDIEKHLLNDEKPSDYLNDLKEKGVLDQKPFNKVKDLEGVEQSKKHHPEGNVWIHTMMVVDEGAKLREKVKDKKAFMWCLLLHDLGKLRTTKLRNGRWTSYDHDKVGEGESREFLSDFTEDEKFIDKVSKLTRYHMHLLYIKNKLPYADIEGMKKYTNAEELSLVFLSDRLGRGDLTDWERRKINEEVDKFREQYKKVVV